MHLAIHLWDHFSIPKIWVIYKLELDKLELEKLDKLGTFYKTRTRTRSQNKNQTRLELESFVNS